MLEIGSSFVVDRHQKWTGVIIVAPKNIWLALRAAKEKRAQMRSNFPKSSFLVHLSDLSRNQIVPSLSMMHKKLIELGFEYYNGKIVINEIETEGSNYHAK